ncbi:NDP-hexose 2,3-dehydratase family protein [Streptomyces sp. P9(2023)]|uniref:NDP-hexose 2,3-dehydratase family protein n=1 Tax=Streptomyces sp. P9(2023) TaxID=3064394 RepID=UPI0028F45823|nr:NDP-hexose 2,3-dehydratase family protein [Streptomyces sp. P9(2023)]MDT9693691.1 NDP-hexose 2,3-dehydratase family protein [Streptomyces sp. P9(2023)]
MTATRIGTGSGGPVAGTALRPRADDALAARLARSAAAPDGSWISTDDFADWLDGRRRAHHFKVERIPFAELDGWSFAEDTGNLVHRSGRFFSVEGLSVTVGEGPFRHWEQPIIRQPEVGILGLLAKEIDGVLHFLMQAKMEPGNRNLLQLSPTVQATRSNYTKVHKGADVKYLEYFTDPDRGRVAFDVLQSEHGSWFYRKANRNMLVEALDEVPHDPDFCWLTLGQIGELLRRDNVINMDSRTIVACFPMDGAEPGALLPDAAVQSWVTVERSRHDVSVERVPLAGIDGWERDEHSLGRPDGRFFKVVAVAVEAGSREVPGWSQPLLEPTGPAVAAFVVRRIGGVPHLLVSARAEAGFLDTIELGPTVQCDPGNWRDVQAPPFLDTVLAAAPERVLYEALHSEEGGRFLHAEIRYLFVEADETQAPLDPPPGFQWLTPGQLNDLAQHAHYVNVQARTLLACLNAGAARLDDVAAEGPDDAGAGQLDDEAAAGRAA